MDSKLLLTNLITGITSASFVLVVLYVTGSLSFQRSPIEPVRARYDPRPIIYKDGEIITRYEVDDGMCFKNRAGEFECLRR